MLSRPAVADESTQDAAYPTLRSVAETTRVLRGDLVRAEDELRHLSHDAAEFAPPFAARLNVAARLIHNAAAALSSDSAIE